MTNPQPTWQDVLDFWIGQHNIPSPGQQKIWFAQSDELDQDIKSRFGKLVEQALAGGLQEWRESPQSCLALIILLDQFCRNIFRGSPMAFAGDHFALTYTKELIQLKQDLQLSAFERVFCYIPFEHAESLIEQNSAVELFTRLEEDAPAGHLEKFKGFTQFAHIHKDIIEKFYRFPHRNDVMGRISTEAELNYIQDGGHTFGQK